MKNLQKITKAIVVGLGNISLRHRRNLKILFPGVFIIAVPSSGKILNQNVEFADQIVLSVEEAIKQNVDIAIVASPSSFHMIHAKPLLLAGVPSLIEKPVTSNLEDAQELIKIQNATGTPVGIGYCLRFMPSTIKMKKLLEQQIIGKVYNAFVSAGQFLPDWRTTKNYKNSVSVNKSLGGGVLLELSHEIDYIQLLLGSMKVQHAQLRFSSELNLEVEDLADVVLISEKGTICNLHLDFLQKKANRTCKLIGEKGIIDWDLQKNTIYLNLKDDEICLFSEPEWDSNQMYLSLLKDFLNLILGNENLITNLQNAFNTIGLIENIKRSTV